MGGAVVLREALVEKTARNHRSFLAAKRWRLRSSAMISSRRCVRYFAGGLDDFPSRSTSLRRALALSHASSKLGAADLGPQ